jgi:hypothetical protein
MLLKTAYTGRELTQGTLEECLNAAKRFYAGDIIDSLTIYNTNGTTFAYISRHNKYESDFIMRVK